MTGATLTPRDDLALCLARFHHAMASTEEDPTAIVDRFCTPDFEQWNDGVRLDREQLIAHARPARRNVTSVRTDVHDVVASGDRAAARYVLTATMRNGSTLASEVYMFGMFAPDGRLQRIDQITRVIKEAAASGQTSR